MNTSSVLWKTRSVDGWCNICVLAVPHAKTNPQRGTRCGAAEKLAGRGAVTGSGGNDADRRDGLRPALFIRQPHFTCFCHSDHQGTEGRTTPHQRRVPGDGKSHELRLYYSVRAEISYALRGCSSRWRRLNSSRMARVRSAPSSLPNVAHSQPQASCGAGVATGPAGP